ncbi:MAG: AAA family ATPase, partial [Planctomycetales bacterium]|nr:AAA family ATPase [Planctomycetales bacterium]
RLQSKLPRGQSWPTCREAVAALDRFMSRRHDGARQAGLWTYRRGCEPIAVVVRYDYATGKTYRPVSRHADGWRWSDPVDSWPLYGDLPESLDCVFVTEGEKCADVVRSFGLVAVTSAHGAGSAQKTDWTKLATAQRVVILPDCDDAGGRYAAEVERLVRSASVSDVRIVELPGLQPGEDAADWSHGRDSNECRAELLALADSATASVAITFQRRRRPKLVRLSDVEPETVRWLWPGRIALGKLTLFAGDPGLGKSFLTMDLAARVTTGTTWPDSPTVSAPRGSVVLLSAEDDLADTIRPRLDAAGADCSRVSCLKAVTTEDDGETGFSLTTDAEMLELAIGSVDDCRLIVIDPITAYLGGCDSHRNAEIRSVLAPLSDLAARHGVSVVAVTHLNKSVGGPAIYRSMGSLAFTAAARAVWSVSKDPCDPARRLVLPVKNNVAQDGSGLAYRIAGDPPRVEWEADPVNMSADDALQPPTSEAAEYRSDRQSARDWLIDALAAGRRPSAELLADGKEIGFAEWTIRRTLKDLCGRPQKDGMNGGWYWSLPAEDEARAPEDDEGSNSF